MADTPITAGDLRAGDVFRYPGLWAEWTVTEIRPGPEDWLDIAAVLNGGSGKGAVASFEREVAVLLVSRGNGGGVLCCGRPECGPGAYCKLAAREAGPVERAERRPIVGPIRGRHPLPAGKRPREGWHANGAGK